MVESSAMLRMKHERMPHTTIYQQKIMYNGPTIAKEIVAPQAVNARWHVRPLRPPSVLVMTLGPLFVCGYATITNALPPDAPPPSDGLSSHNSCHRL
ncbi:hypothetical protein C8Q79DRAFT_444206 [Trametes meyenii]|nr:hypothetical protein C8Q79DRAFT_444206 [Trametes meyenii]